MTEKKAELKPTNASDHRCIPPDVPGFPGYRKDIFLTKDDFRLIGRTRKKKYVFQLIMQEHRLVQISSLLKNAPLANLALATSMTMVLFYPRETQLSW